MAASDARPVPIKNTAYRVTFPIFDADGDLVTGAGSLDSEVSKDGGAFADCTNEATEIATASGVYYLDLTSTEMNADTVAIIVKSASGKTTPIILYPQEAGDIKVDVESISGDTVAADNAEAMFDGTGYAGGTIKLGVDVVAISGDSAAADNLEAYTDGTTPIPANATQISGDATAADNLEAAADGTGYNLGGGQVIAASVTGAVGSVTGNVGDNVSGSVGSVATGGITAASIATNAIDADALAADAVTEIQAGLATAAALAVVDGIVDDILVDTSTTLQAELDGIQSDTEDIQSRLPAALVGGRMDASVGAMAANVLTAAALAADAVAEIWAGITATAGNWIADHVLRRRTANVEASAEGDTIVGADSLYGMIQQHRAADTTTNPGSLTIFESDGTTELEQLALATDAAADPVTGVG